MQEYRLQKKLLSMAFDSEKVAKSKGKKAYKFLVYYRFFEVLSNAYPIFFTLVNRARFEKIIYKFMRYGAKSNVMWKVPNEFRKFVKKQKHFREFKFIDDLLWFEWSEVALMMQTKKLQQEGDFSWDHSCVMSSSASIKKLRYRVFDAPHYTQNGEFFLLAYYDRAQSRVFYREISQLLYLFLKILKKRNLMEAVVFMSEQTSEDAVAVKAFFEPTLNELWSIGVLQNLTRSTV